MKSPRANEILLWGLIFGAGWWLVGSLTLLPLFTGRPVTWDLAGAQAQLPSLFGGLFCGATAGLVFGLFRRGTGWHWPRGTLLRGVIGGVLGGLIAGGPVIGFLAGIGYPLLFDDRREGSGPALVRGTVYGFLLWVLFPLTVNPLLDDQNPAWTQPDAAAAIGQLPGYVLLGAAIALLSTTLSAVVRGLFVDDIRMVHVEALGTRGLRAVGYGAVAGLAGGLVFTVVMVAVGALPRVAQMVGSHVPAVGLVVHLVIAQIIGVSYAVLFRRRSFDVVSGLGWGLCYGFFWWVLGNLTLLPVLTGGVIDWSATGVAAGFPSLVGHLAYGAALGGVYYVLEARTNPWWMTRSKAEAERSAARRELTLGTAPAMWAFTVLIAVIIPVLAV